MIIFKYAPPNLGLSLHAEHFPQSSRLQPSHSPHLRVFAAVLLVQVLGMFVHRWMTLSHIISTTKLDWCNKKAADETGDGTLDKEAIEFVSALQRDNTTLQPTSISPGGAATGNDLADKDHP